MARPPVLRCLRAVPSTVRGRREGHETWSREGHLMAPSFCCPRTWDGSRGADCGNRLEDGLDMAYTIRGSDNK